MPVPAYTELTAEHLALGAVLLELISDWDAWVFRRVDSFLFAGDDERVLERQQSMDFMIPTSLANLPTELGEELAGFPIPVTFVNKWRLPHFSMRNNAGHVVTLIPRQDSTMLATGMLVALASLRVNEELIPKVDDVPEDMRTLLFNIVSGEPADALKLCTELGEPTLEGSEDSGDPDDWSAQLATDPVFMSLAYELARGFLLTALYPLPVAGHRVLKFSYSSYVVPAQRDRLPVICGHLLRALRQRSFDETDTTPWRRSSAWGRRGSGQVMFSTVCDAVSEAPREGGPRVACALATLIGTDGHRRTMRLRPNTAVAFVDLPPGRYRLQLKGCSGFRIDEGKVRELDVGVGETARVHIRATRRDVAGRPTLAAPLIARYASPLRTMSRGLAWHSKPLAIRVRVGDGGSYHCEFEAPAGLHVTRARLISDIEFESDGDRAGSRELSVALTSTPSAHLYAPAYKAKPAAAYVYLNLRPRVETIARPAFWTASVATAVLLFLALVWRPDKGFTNHGPDDSSALLVVLLGAPSALAAYFAQAVPSRVANWMLYGLRISALLPGILALGAGCVALIGQDARWSSWALWALFVLSVLTTSTLWATQHYAEHPREQRLRDIAKKDDPEHHRWGSRSSRKRTNRPIHILSAVTPPDSDSREAIRDLMLERGEGLAAPTRLMLLSQPKYFGREVEISPALYFDSAETPPTFAGFGSDEALKKVREQVQAHLLAGALA